MSERFREALTEHTGVIGHVTDLLAVLFEPAVALMENTVMGGGKILTCGNGGSAADAAHLAAELTVRYKTDRNPIAALSLAADPSTITACANDYGYQHVFARQVRALGRPGDLLVAISTSGNSASVVEAVLAAKAGGLSTLGLSGIKGLKGGCDVDLNVPSINTPRIQEAHILIIHTLVEELERRIRQ
jgi:D-sedoheptulose 7-phosphate isomerase